jgi:hypothetical protein
VNRLATDGRFAGVKVFRVDFDSSKALLREWKVQHQSTLLAWKGKSERMRSTGETDESVLRRVFEAAL